MTNPAQGEDSSPAPPPNSEAAAVTVSLGRRHLEDALNACLPQLLGEVRELLAVHSPEYAHFLQDDDKGVQELGALFVHRLLDMAKHGLEHPGGEVFRSDETVRLVFEQIGRRQWQGGNDLTRLLTAFQLGARAAWRHVSATAVEQGIAPRVLAALADAVFVFVNQLSFAAARGYIMEQTADATARERNREELAELLLSDRSTIEAVRAAAARTGWAVPATGAVVLIDPHDEPARAVLAKLDQSCLPIRHDGLFGAIVPDLGLAGRRERIARMLLGANAVVGYTAPLDLLPRSAVIAKITADLRRAGVVKGDPVFADEELDSIIVHREPRLIQELRRQALAPLADLPDGARARLTETLTSWLRNMGDRAAMAEELGIHPHTVRYRIGQLRDNFGDQLDQPRSRARLFLALEWPSV